MYCWMPALLGLVTGWGSILGIGGGSWCLGQSQSDRGIAWFRSTLAALTEYDIVSSIIGKLVVIIFKLVHASWPEEDVCYVCYLMVSTVVWFFSSPLNLKIAAPGILIPLVLALCILRDTGMSSCNVIPRRSSNLTPAKQLWHPVSAMHGAVTCGLGADFQTKSFIVTWVDSNFEADVWVGAVTVFA